MGYSFTSPSLKERLSQRRVEDKGASTPLNRCLGLPSLVVQGLSHMLGAGVFIVTPEIIQGTAGPATFICYLISGLAAFFSVVCYSDLASRYTCCGSAYVYTYFSVGEFVAALVGFFLIGEMFIQAPMLALGISENLDRFFFNSTIETWEDGFPKWMGHVHFIAITVMLLFLAINLFGIKSVAHINIAVAIVSTSCLLLFCVIALIYGDVKNLYEARDPTTGLSGFAPYGFKGIIKGAGTAFFAFVGLESVVCLAEEAKDPKRDIPRATFISFVAVLLLYVLTAFSLAYFAPWYTLDGTTGMIGSLESRGFTFIQYLLAVGLLFTVFSCGLCTMTTVSRIIYSVAEDGLLFSFLSSVTARTMVPSLNLIVSAAVGILASVVYDFETLLHMVSGGTLMVFSITALSVIVISYDVSGTTIVETHQEDEYTSLTTSTNNKHKHVFYSAISVYTISVLIAVCLLTFVEQGPVAITFEFLLLALALAALTLVKLIIPENPENKDLSFRSPFIPFVPGLCMLINLFLFVNLELKAVQQLLIYVLIGLGVYFFYGIFFSKITAEKQSKKMNNSMIENSLQNSKANVPASRSVEEKAF